MTRPENCIDPDRVVIDKPMTARDLFIMSCRSDMNALAQAALVKPDQQHTLTITINLTFVGEDVKAMLAADGFHVEPGPAANDPGVSQ